jgi:Zn-dependent metalloprotease
MCQARGSHRLPVLCIVPPHILRHIARGKTGDLADWALHTLALSERLRGGRAVLGPLAPIATTPAGVKRRAVYNAGHAERLPGRLVRSEGDPPAKDVAVNEAYDGAGVTYDLYREAFGRNSIDDRGMRLDSSVHYGRKFDNAFWDGRQMVYGDGDGVLFRRFTVCIDVIGHELAHGVTEAEAALDYQDQPGALNESLSDVFGALVKQYHLGQTAAQADWLIGAGLFARGVKGEGLRSMKAPGTAYDDPRIGKDPQPAHMMDYVETHEDSGGVHVNSGIPNRAFHLAAAAIGGQAWRKAGRIWYLALRDRLRHDSDFAAAARATAETAAEAYGPDSTEAGAVREAWQTVGVTAAVAARRTHADRVQAQRRVRGPQRAARPRKRRASRRRT